MPGGINGGSGECNDSLPRDKKMLERDSPKFKDVELHACTGLNSCKNNDIFGDIDCAGKGYCATSVSHVCKTLNDCKCQGGCGLFGSDMEQLYPGENECKQLGTCATPIQAERFGTSGSMKGLSVWILARKRFEDRMNKRNKSYGDSPCRNGPPQEWISDVFKRSGRTYDSCGASGDKACSFGYNNPEKTLESRALRTRKKIEELDKNSGNSGKC